MTERELKNIILTSFRIYKENQFTQSDSVILDMVLEKLKVNGVRYEK